MYDLYGASAKYNMLRRAIRPLVGHYIAVSRDLEQWLESCIGVRRGRLSQIYNGVDSRRFHPREEPRQDIGPPGFLQDGSVGIGTIGRMQTVKDQVTLAKAFIHLLHEEPAWRQSARLVLVGEGPLRQQCLDLLAQAGLQHMAWIPGERDDVAEILRALDLFVLPSLGEGISNTILEAMATGLPVLATEVGGNAELVQAGETGTLVPPADHVAMAKAMRAYLVNPDLRIRHGQAGRKMVEDRFSIEAMVQGYLNVYDRLLNGESWRSSPAGSLRMGEA
jgi:sugar transferase (PEP-CTERM/EpsH1 system associated)